MPELPNVISGEVIESDWGNDIRDRTIQRYASAAARTAAHAAPVQGDLSFLTDTGKVYVYYSGAWRQFDDAHASTHNMGGADALAADEVDGADSAASGSTLGGYQDFATVTLSIPAGWGGYKVTAWANWIHEHTGAVTTSFLIRIVGTDGATNTIGSTLASGAFASLLSRRSGITATGSQPVTLRGRHNESTVATLRQIYLYARAIRTS